MKRKHRWWIRLGLFLLCCVLLPLSAKADDEASSPAPNQLTAEELADGWILLFDGETDYGWRAASDADWKVADGMISVSSGAPGLLCTTSQFGDYELSLEFRAAPETNSGIFLRTSPRPKNPAGDCYELNIAPPSNPFPTGSFVGRQKTTAEVPDDGNWHRYHILAEGGHFTVELDGQQVLDYTDPKPLGRGFIGLQLNQGAVDFRDIKLKPLGMNELFNGEDLTGWRVYPGKESEFSVTPEGELTIVNGNGQIETEAEFDDFVLQIEVFVNGEGLNSGIFFRSIPGEFWQGYESQIQNAFDGSRDNPVDCGTGGFYRRQNARRIVANDFEWFTKTLVVSDKHMATWVNGIQVSDWTDPRSPDENPRKGLRMTPGTISLQGHDPTTDLRFRNIRAGAIAPRRKSD